MQGGIKKEYEILNNKPVLIHSILTFLSTNLFFKLVVTIPKADIDKVRNILSPFVNFEKINIVSGGSSRQESVFLGLKEFEKSPPDYILIHDGARPWITGDLINLVHETTKKHDACIPVVEVPDALKEIDDQGNIVKGLSRKLIKGAQTPQGFHYNRLLQAHYCASEKKMEALDDAEVYMLLYQPVVTILGDVRNKKITYRCDIP